MDISDRSLFDFQNKARAIFAFLKELGFSEVKSTPTLIRFQSEDVEVDIYHGRQSYEIKAEITTLGTSYTLAEIIRATDPGIATNFRYPSVTTAEGVLAGLDELSKIIKRYGSQALSGDSQFYITLNEHRKRWAEDYSREVLAQQLKPQAAEAFRKKDYITAAQLYYRIKDSLSPAEEKKMWFAEKQGEFKD